LNRSKSNVLTLYFHPLASYCHKVLIALHENGTPFEPKIVNFGDEESVADLLARWPLRKIPVLHDQGRARTVAETSIIIEYLDEAYPGPIRFIPKDRKKALEVRLWDRVFDLYVHTPMQKIVADRLRPAGSEDRHGVAEAKTTLRTAYDMIDAHLENRDWAGGSDFTMADCSATPALFYAGIIVPFGEKLKRLSSYFERLLQRPSVVRTLREAQPYFHLFPYRDIMPERFLRL
jgi:glutathione S-transferase